MPSVTKLVYIYFLVVLLFVTAFVVVVTVVIFGFCSRFGLIFGLLLQGLEAFLLPLFFGPLLYINNTVSHDIVLASILIILNYW